MSSMRGLAILAFCACVALVQGGRGDEKDPAKIDPDSLFDTPGHRRSAEPSEVRVYPADKDGRPDRSKLPVIVDAQPNKEYRLKDGEVAAYHQALDISPKSRIPNASVENPKKVPFKAGVYGMVVASKPGRISVLLENGNRIDYNHVSSSKVAIGDYVKPYTVLGETGNLGPYTGKPIPKMAPHLHIQAVDPKKRLIDPDQALLGGRKEPARAKLLKLKLKWVDPGPIVIEGKKPKVGADGVVKADAANRKLYYDGTDITAEARKQAQEAEEQRKRLEAEFNKR